MSNKDLILAQLKNAWKQSVIDQYNKDPQAVINADLEKNTQQIWKTPTVKAMLRISGIRYPDVKQVLTDIREEVIKEMGAKV